MNDIKKEQQPRFWTTVKKMLLALVLLGAFASCEKTELDSYLEDTKMETRAPKKTKKTRKHKVKVKANEDSGAQTRAYESEDGQLVWKWQPGDALIGYQVAYDMIRNRLAYDINTNEFSNAEFTYQSTAPEVFHFIYPSAAEYTKGKLKAVQDGVWRPVSVHTTEKIKIDALSRIAFEQLSSALELRIWDSQGAMTHKVNRVVLTSNDNFVGEWTLDANTMTYTQSLNGKEMVVEGFESSIVQINMPNLPDGYSAGTKIKMVLTRTDGKTMTTYLPENLTFVKQMRTVYNMEFIPDPTFTCATYNVDGLPSLINNDGPGSDGTKQISSKLAASEWDFIAFQEDFNYHNELKGSMNQYAFGTHRGGVGISIKDLLSGSFLQFDTDGLGIAALYSTCSWSNQTYVKFDDAYGGITDGANTNVEKGFRYYLVTMNDGVEFDVYVTHMNSGSNTGHINARASQFQQLAKYINEHRSGRPIIIMGDLNARYTRDDYATNFWGVLDTDLYANLQDAWTELIWGGYYPEYGTNSWVVTDKYNPDNTVGDIEYGEQEGEVVDKILYINDPNSDVRIFAKSYKRDMEYKDLADHVPVVVEFGYEKISE